MALVSKEHKKIKILEEFIMKKTFGSILLKQVLAAKEFISFKTPKMPKREKSTKQSYIPGSLGVSNISKAIREDHGTVLNRRERKQKAKNLRQPFQAYYN
jgi:hypothetical protein